MNYQKHSQVKPNIGQSPGALPGIHILDHGCGTDFGIAAGSQRLGKKAPNSFGQLPRWLHGNSFPWTLDGGAPWVPNIPDDELSVGGRVLLVGPGDSVNDDFVITEVNGAWAATEWVFGNSGDPGTFACVSSPDHPVYTGILLLILERLSFSVTTPSGTVPGTYDLARIHR